MTTNGGVLQLDEDEVAVCQIAETAPRAADLTRHAAGPGQQDLHFIGCFLKNSHIRSLAEMFMADLPMKLAGGFMPRPGVTAVFNDDQHDLGPVLAAAVGLAGHFHLVPVLGKRVGLRLLVAAVQLHPGLDRILDPLSS